MVRTRIVARLARLPSLPTVLGVLASAGFGLLMGGLLAALLATQVFGYHVVTVQSFSMEPALERGDLIVSQPVNIDDVKQGQVVLFMEGQETRILVAHRVAGFVNVTTNIHNSETGEDTVQESRLLQTKGDANPTVDAQAVAASDLRGRLWFTIPKVGLILDRVPLQTLLLSVAAVTGIAWLAFELWQRRSRRRGGPPRGSASLTRSE
jgi:signal peptidase